MKVSISELKDFQTCERLYDYRHLQSLPEKIGGRTLLSTKFENTIKSVVNYFFYKKQGGLTPSYSSLLNRWEKLWYPKDATAYDIIYEQHESLYGNISSLTTKAATVLLDISENFSDPDIIPIGIDEDYLAPITKQVSIYGKFDLIYSKNNSIYVVKWIFNHKMKNNDYYVMDFTSMYIGFANKFGQRVSMANFGYCDLMNQKNTFISHEIEPSDMEALKYWCNSLSEEKIFPSRRGLTSYCKVCPFDSPCSKWSNWYKKESSSGKK